MASKQVIAVFGATGNQGGSVVDVFLADPALSAKWQIRAITRDPTKESSKALAARGVEVVAVRVWKNALPSSFPPLTSTPG
jgi:uncharacterized protein YbjT (DUF2867 family)